MSKERKEELFRALNTILDAVTALNLRDLEAEAAAAVAADRGKTSTQGASAFSKGKNKVANPNWEDIPYNPIPITPLSSRPRFSQVVGSSSESPIVPRSPISAAVHAMANAAGGAGPTGGNPPPPPLPYASGAQFNAQWDACVTNQARAALEQKAITRSPIQDVQFAAMVRSTCGCRRRLASWQAKFKQLRLLPMMRKTLIVSGLRRLPSMGTRSRAGM
jgi:hypothetical protein